MVKYFKFFEFAYLVIAIIFVVEMVLNWSLNRQKAYIYLAFSALAVFMYFSEKSIEKNMKIRKDDI